MKTASGTPDPANPFPAAGQLFRWIVFSHLAFYMLCGLGFGVVLVGGGVRSYEHINLPFGFGTFTAGAFEGPLSPVGAFAFATLGISTVGLFHGLGAWLITLLGLKASRGLHHLSTEDSVERPDAIPRA